MSMQVGHTREVSAANDAKVAEMTRRGYTAREIAQALGVTMRTVTRSRRRTGVSTSPRYWMTDDEIAAARTLLEDGCSFAETARTLGRGASTIAAHFPGRGWTQDQVVEYATWRRETRAVL